MKKDPITKAMNEAVSDGVFPSAELLVANREDILFHDFFGKARAGTCFDIASLTKPLCSATLSMMLVAEGLLKLTDSVFQWLGGARFPAHRKMTVEHLLNHTSGLPDWQPYYRQLPLSLIGTGEGKQALLEEIFREPLISEVGEKTIYSDIGYILLGQILEEAGDAPLDQLFLHRIARPLDLHDTFFRRIIGAKVEETLIAQEPTLKATRKHHAGHRRFAPTQDCPWRRRVLHGEVDDANAYALGGVSAHAGLFSTAHDIHHFLTTFVACYEGKRDWIPQATLREFLDFTNMETRRNEPMAFTGGWMVPSRTNSSAGKHFSSLSIGHLGYTGCSIWVDLKRQLWVILLTNRVHPSTTNNKIRTFRPKLHNLVMEELMIS